MPRVQPRSVLFHSILNEQEICHVTHSASQRCVAGTCWAGVRWFAKRQLRCGPVCLSLWRGVRVRPGL